MAKSMVIKGVGTLLAKRASGANEEIITLGKLQDLKITFNVGIEDIYGGDGLFPFDTLVKDKSIEVTATNAVFDLSAIQLMMGSNIQSSVQDSVWVLNEGHTVVKGSNGTAEVGVVTSNYATTLATDPEFTVNVEDGLSLIQIPYATDTNPAIGSFMVKSDGSLIFNSSLETKNVYINYKRTETVDVATLLTDEVPFPVRVIHHGSFLQKDGTFKGIETELYSCRAKGSFSIDAKRASASAPQIDLVLVDPERPDGKIGTVKIYDSAVKS
jgi:hypothetical protein